MYTAIAAPIGSDGLATPTSFFKTCLALFIVIAFWIGGYLWKREGYLKVSQIDVDTGRRELDWDAINAYRRQVAAYPAWKRLLTHLF